MFFLVGGLLNATCGNATELIIAIFALANHKVDVVKYSLIGSILSNLLLVLGTSLLCGGILNISSEQRFDRVRFHFTKNVIVIIGLINIYKFESTETSGCELPPFVVGTDLPCSSSDVSIRWTRPRFDRKVNTCIVQG